nr:hypothetical protein Iba_chr14aCG9660 [Ipomoea batatas]
MVKYSFNEFDSKDPFNSIINLECSLVFFARKRVLALNRQGREGEVSPASRHRHPIRREIRRDTRGRDEVIGCDCCCGVILTAAAEQSSMVIETGSVQLQQGSPETQTLPHFAQPRTTVPTKTLLSKLMNIGE